MRVECDMLMDGLVLPALRGHVRERRSKQTGAATCMQDPNIQSDYGKLSASVTVLKAMDCFTTFPLCTERFSFSS